MRRVKSWVGSWCVAGGSEKEEEEKEACNEWERRKIETKEREKRGMVSQSGREVESAPFNHHHC